MAENTRQDIWEGGETAVTKAKSVTPAFSGLRQPPVRVRLKRINATRSQTYPPVGDAKDWWGRLQAALGTQSSAFLNASLVQLQAAARLPCSGVSETGMNAALAMIEAAAPRDEIEAALSIQIACTHAASMSVLSRFGSGGGGERRVTALASAAARLMQVYMAQVETLRRLRHGGNQYVRVEHIHIEGSHAVIGNVKGRDS